jgi:hypothetical protein
MKIFISWSGKHSRLVASALNVWLPQVIPAVKPFYSPKIKKGVFWSKAIAAELKGTSFGIICLTPDNLDSPWIHYEAGALSKTQGAMIWTFLHGLQHKEIPSPLGEFQSTVAEKGDVRQLLKTINGKLGKARSAPKTERPLKEAVLEETFDRLWPRLEKRLRAIKKKMPAPVTSPSPDNKYKELDKLFDYGIETIHVHLSDDELQGRLERATSIQVLKTWFPETKIIATGLERAIKEKKAKVKLLLCAPESPLLQQRSFNALQKRELEGSYAVYTTIEEIHRWLQEEPGATVEIGLYNSWPGCPVIWYDETILMGFYFRGLPSPAWPWVSIRPKSKLARTLNDQFKELWTLSDPRTEHLMTSKDREEWLKKKKKEWKMPNTLTRRGGKRKKGVEP